MKCPICEQEFTKYIIDTHDGNFRLEEEKECKDCSYRYFFAYGQTITTVGRVSVEESYNDSGVVSELKQKIIDIAIQITKEEPN